MHHHLALVGLVALALLALFLLPWQVSVPAAILLATVGVVAELQVARAQRRPLVTGPGSMVGERAVVRSGAGTEIEVYYRGELWRALSDQPLRPGDVVIIQCIERLTLHVTPAEPPTKRQASTTGGGVKGP